MKRVSILFLIVILILGVSGCMNNRKTDEGSTRAKMISYMEEKYDEDFEYVNSTDGGFDSDKKDILLSTKKMPNENIEVSYRKNAGVEIYKENYTQLKYKKQTYELIEKLMSDIFCEGTIITHEIKKSENEFNNETSFEEFLKSDNSNVYFYAVVSHKYKINNLENLEKEIKEKVSSNFTNCSVNIYFANSEDEFKSIHDIPTWKIDEMKKIKFIVGK